MLTKPAARIIKKKNITIDGKISLDSAGNATAAGTQQSAPKPGAKATAKIIETTQTYATIEVTCGCGTKSYIQCNYIQ
ncbi:hypothetical protein STSP2_00075 [Anaerohalosphaera lusitana]|uniref:Uncharacterized protein n=1 Tax=Anaerohalosphaera lusitana TaxID=1936003 RepID=A0A1U9NGP7_9BACT|nr:hypothetical protein [Anaerohalosphaera lusitana]AQT66937.1 hypothetical protein STSP2_00075 [Anaerohalosphaera lusitana]